MLDDFFIRAIVAAVGVALIAGPFGCFVVWRRMAYFGDTLAHSALLGVALGLLLQINLTFSVFLVSTVLACALLVLQRLPGLSSDSLLGLLSHSALALGLVTLAFLTWLRVDLMSFLFGDILAVSKSDIGLIYGGGILLIAILAMIWRPLLAATVSPDIALAEGMKGGAAQFIFMLLMATVIAISMKLVGVLLVTALLIIPAATARHLAKSPEQMALGAMAIGCLSAVTGLLGSLQWDTPSGPSVVVAAFLFFVVVSIVVPLLKMRDGDV